MAPWIKNLTGKPKGQSSNLQNAYKCLEGLEVTACNPSTLKAEKGDLG